MAIASVEAHNPETEQCSGGGKAGYELSALHGDLSLRKSELRSAACATGMTTLAVHVRRLFHRFALRTAILLSVAYFAAAIGMSAFLVIGHWWLLSSGAPEILPKPGCELNRPAEPRAIVCASRRASHPVIP